MTATAADVSWASPAPGAFTRQLRFGEWISEPVTPLFESWLLQRMEEELHRQIYREIGQRAPLPHHVIVNGWYFYSVNWIAPGNMLRSLSTILLRFIRQPRVLAGVIPPTVRHSVPLTERMWRDDIQPRYRAAVADAEPRVSTMPVSELPGLIDALSTLAGEYFMSIAAFAGAGYKLDINLARFWQRHLAPTLGGSHLPLLAGFDIPVDPGPHAVTSLDWWFEAPGRNGATPRNHARVVADRQAAEAAAFEALAESPRRLAQFRQLLADAQRLVPLREEQVREWTLAWPVMHRAVLRIGEALVERGLIAVPDDAFFLTRAEVQAALEGRSTASIDTAARRAK